MDLARTMAKSFISTRTFLLAAAFIIFTAFIWHVLKADAAVRVTYRLTVEANDGPGTASSSGIFQVTIRPSYAPNGAMIVEISGDALFIERKHEDNLIVMMSHDRSATDETTFGVLPFISIWGSRYYHYNQIVTKKEKLSGSGEVPLRQIPTIIALDASRAPATARRIWPSVDLSRARLDQIPPPPVRARIDVLQHGPAVTRTIHEYIPWIEDTNATLVALGRAELRHPLPFRAFRR